MQSEALQYVMSRDIIRKEPLYSANRFARLVGDFAPADLATAHLDQYRVACLAKGLSPKTIESSVADLMTVVLHFTGTRPHIGQRLRVPHPRPCPVPLDSFCAVWAVAPDWLQQWMVVAYWTGLRLSDAMRLCVSLQDNVPDVIRIEASKTGKPHCFPVPEWFRGLITPTSLPFSRATDFGRKRLRRAIRSACRRGKVSAWTPKQIRQLSINEWTRASSTAGALIHGCGLGVMRHYLDPLSVLEAAAPRVRLPACFGATPSETEGLLSSFIRLDPSGQRLIRETAQRLAGAG